MDPVFAQFGASSLNSRLALLYTTLLIFFAAMIDYTEKQPLRGHIGFILAYGPRQDIVHHGVESTTSRT